MQTDGRRRPTWRRRHTHVCVEIATLLAHLTLLLSVGSVFLLGTALFYVVYELVVGSPRPSFGITWIDTLEWSSLAWTISYLLSILWQHSLHRHLVFGSSSPYLSSLLWTYVSYTFSIVLSSIVNHGLVTFFSLHHRIAFTATLVITGFINFYTLKGAFETTTKVTTD